MDLNHRTRFNNIMKRPNGSRRRHDRPAGKQLWRQDLKPATPCVSGGYTSSLHYGACRVRPAVVRQLTMRRRNLNTTVTDIQESARYP